MDGYSFYIDDYFVPETYFWNAIQGMIKPMQITKLLSGERLVIGGVSYQIIKTE